LLFSAILKFFRVLNTLSIDIAFGAICSSFLFYKILDITPKWEENIILAITVWLIYTADHLIDARKIDGLASTFRHRFHQKYFGSILAVFSVLLCLNIYLVFNSLNSEVFRNGVFLSILVIIHHLICHLTKIDTVIPTKELRIAILYSCGIALVPYSNAVNFELSFYLLLVIMVGIAFLNLILFASIETESDEKDQFHSISRKIESQKLNSIFYLISLLTFVLIVSFYFSHAQSISTLTFLLCLMLGILVIIHFIKVQAKSKDLYRIIGDGIFLLPAILRLF
jgi:hypothetical protein